MNLYSNKQKWKIALLFFAIILVGVSLFYTSRIVGSVELRERERVSQWADVIQKKAELIKLTNQTFDELRERERQKVQLWARATRELVSTISFETDLTFALDIIKENEDVPVILLDDKMRFVSSKNIPFEAEDLKAKYPEAKPVDLSKIYGDSLSALAQVWSKSHEPIEIKILDNFRQYIYYFDSEKLMQLEQQRDSLLLSFNRELIDNTTMVPVIFINENDQILIETNIDSLKKYRAKQLNTLMQVKSAMLDSLDILLGANTRGKLYFDDSKELKQLKFYPYLQFALIGLFIFIGYIIFSTFRKAEQNQVWAGMAKETAHQLGTPISSLMAWIQLLESQGHPKSEILEMNKDIDRLTTIADRFEKIGSGAKLEANDLNETVQKAFDYLRYRLSKRVEFELQKPDGQLIVMHNPSLIEWVLENICKNAVDAMDGKGNLSITVTEQGMNVHIDIKDSGKGIPSNKVKTIFQPGYTTKQRGWGLGLSLVKRIIDTYHKGRVFVLSSEMNKGTTFRVTLRKP